MGNHPTTYTLRRLDERPQFAGGVGAVRVGTWAGDVDADDLSRRRAHVRACLLGRSRGRRQTEGPVKGPVRGPFEAGTVLRGSYFPIKPYVVDGPAWTGP